MRVFQHTKVIDRDLKDQLDALPADSAKELLAFIIRRMGEEFGAEVAKTFIPTDAPDFEPGTRRLELRLAVCSVEEYTADLDRVHAQAYRKGIAEGSRRGENAVKARVLSRMADFANRLTNEKLIG